MTNIGNGEYKHLVSRRDYIDIISEKISPEFAAEIEEELEWANRCKHELLEEVDSDCRYIELENEELRNQLFDAGAYVSSFLRPLLDGHNLNRQKTIKFLQQLEKELEVDV